MSRILLASLHLVALGIGLGTVWARGRSLRGAPDATRLRQALVADAWWGIAALLWVATGLARWLGGVEKPAGYYSASHVFLGKMGLFALVLVLELRPMLTLIAWRRRLARGEAVDLSASRAISTISHVQALIVILIVIAATAMARGYGAGTP